MKQKNGGFFTACCVGFSGLSMLLLGAGPSWAGVPVPAPLAGVAGPIGLLAAGAAYGGYLLFKRLRNRG